MDRDEALSLLKGGREGITEWNRRRDAGEEFPDLSAAELSAADLAGANLAGAVLSTAKFITTNLSHARLGMADLTGALLAGANLRGAHLDGAILRGANLADADLMSASLRRADLSNADLTGAELHMASLNRSNLSGAKLCGAKLQLADLCGSTLCQTDLTGADFRITNSGGLFHELMDHKGLPIHFDGNRVKDARFPPWLREAWSILRRTYTGPKLAFLLVFTVLAFLPFLGQIIFWLILNRMERRIYPIGVAAIRKTVAVLRHSNDAQVAAWVQNAEKFLAETDHELEHNSQRTDVSSVSLTQVRRMTTLLNDGARALRSIDDSVRLPRNLPEIRDSRYWMDLALISIQPMVPEGKLPGKERRIWQLLLGTDYGIGTILLTTTLLVYNALRAFVTYRLGPLRDEEERTSETPAWNDYWLYWRTHQILSALLYVSVASCVIQAWRVLFTPVLVFG